MVLIDELNHICISSLLGWELD